MSDYSGWAARSSRSYSTENYRSYYIKYSSFIQYPICHSINRPLPFLQMLPAFYCHPAFWLLLCHSTYRLPPPSPNLQAAPVTQLTDSSPVTQLPCSSSVTQPKFSPPCHPAVTLSYSIVTSHTAPPPPTYRQLTCSSPVTQLTGSSPVTQLPCSSSVTQLKFSTPCHPAVTLSYPIVTSHIPPPPDLQTTYSLSLQAPPLSLYEQAPPLSLNL